MFVWARGNPLRAALAAVVLLAAVGGVVGVVLWLAAPPALDGTLDMAMAALDAGEYELARHLAEALHTSGLSPEGPLGGPAFVLGASAVYEADDAWTANKGSLYLVAARYLEEARDLGFPPGREGQGLFLLGRSLYLSRQLPACRPALLEALKAYPEKKTEIHRLLAAAYSEDANPKLSEALEHNTVYLADRTLSAENRHEGLLQRAQILLRLDKTTECLDALDKIPQKAKNHAEAIVTRGWVLIHEARALKAPPRDAEENRRKAAEKYNAAIQTLRRAQGYDSLAAHATRKAMYLIGVCFQELDDHGAAETQFQRTRSKYPSTPEALAADFQMAELSRGLGHDDEALAGYRRALKAVTDADEYSNPWLPLDQLRARVLRAYEHYRDGEDFEICLQLTWLLHPAFSRARTIELTAETHQLWGRSLVARADDLPPSKAEPLRREGRTQLRRAGRTYHRLARLRVTTGDYPDDLWKSAECYREGKGYQSAIRILREYLRSQTSRRRPRALVNLGEALMAIGQIDEAITEFKECIRFHPRDAAAFRARVAASRAYFEKREVDRAEELLEENLNGEFLTPKSDEWRESLFALGQMLHLIGRYEDATDRLEEAVARYPEAPQAIEARYLIADSYQRRARQLKEKLEEDLVESARVARSKKISEYLSAALDQYQQVRETLSHRQRAAELTRLEKSMLRNCYFSSGGILFDLRRYEEAIAAYSTVTNRYQNVPEVLEAYVQIALAYRALGEPAEAQRALEQAKVVLNRMKTTQPFEQTTIYTQQQWPELLGWLSGL